MELLVEICGHAHLTHTCHVGGPWPVAQPVQHVENALVLGERFRTALGADGTQVALMILRAGRGPLCG